MYVACSYPLPVFALLNGECRWVTKKRVVGGCVDLLYQPETYLPHEPALLCPPVVSFPFVMVFTGRVKNPRQPHWRIDPKYMHAFLHHRLDLLCAWMWRRGPIAGPPPDRLDLLLRVEFITRPLRAVAHIYPWKGRSGLRTPPHRLLVFMRGRRSLRPPPSASKKMARKKIRRRAEHYSLLSYCA